jgi:hypothetical protein
MFEASDETITRKQSVDYVLLPGFRPAVLQNSRGARHWQCQRNMIQKFYRITPFKK